MSKKEQDYTEEFIQGKIDAASEGSFYYDVSSLWSRTAVIGGAKRRWSDLEEGADEESDDHIVYAPGGRLCGPRSLVISYLDKFNIDDKSLYSSVDSPGFQEELDEYKKGSSECGLLDDDAMTELKAKIKRGANVPSLKAMIKELASGKAVNVTDAKEGKLTVVNAPLATSSSRYVCVPGLNVVSKSEEGFLEALNQLEIAEDKQQVYIEAFTALAKLQKPKADKKTPPKAKAASKATASTKKTAPAKVAGKATASAKKTAPAKAPPKAKATGK